MSSSSSSSSASESVAASSELRLELNEFAKAFPREYLLNFLQRDVRPDGRLLLETRPTSLHTGVIGSADSSATAQRGGTVVTCGLKLEVGAPHTQTPNEGRLAVTAHMAPLAFSALEVGRPSKESAALGEHLAQIVLGCGTIELDQLCIAPGQAVWVIYADLVFLSYDGDALDVCLHALVAALENLSLPTTEISNEGIVSISDHQAPARIVVSRRPRCFSFGCIDRFLLADPTAAEEDMLESVVSVCYATTTGASDTAAVAAAASELELCGIYKHGGAKSLSVDRVRDISQRAREQALVFRYANMQQPLAAGKRAPAFASPPPAAGKT